MTENYSPTDQEQEEAAEVAGRAERSERFASTENVLQGAAHYVSASVDTLEAHPYAALTYLRAARTLLDQAEEFLIDAANR